LRLGFSGHAFTPDLEFFLQFDGNTDNQTETRFLDYFATYDVGHALFGHDQDQLGLKFRKWKVPFSRSRVESGRLLQSTGRASANVFFDINRATGVGVYGQVEPCFTPVHFETAVFNGFATGDYSTSRIDEQIDRNIGWSLRSHVDPLGESGNDGEPDLSWHESPALRLGSGAAHTRVDQQGTSEFSRQRGVDSGASLSGILPAAISAYDVWLYTVDAHLKCRGFSFIADYYWRYITQFSGGNVPSLYDDGFVLQTGYFVVPETLELHVRWSRIAGASGTLGLTQQSSDEVAAGMAWFLNGNNAKVLFDVTHFNGVPLSSNRVDVLPGDIGWLMRTQFQLAF
jgi:hypothetical protein